MAPCRLTQSCKNSKAAWCTAQIDLLQFYCHHQHDDPKILLQVKGLLLQSDLTDKLTSKQPQ